MERCKDLCISIDNFCADLSSGLAFQGSSVPSAQSINNVEVTGKSGRKTKRINPRSRKLNLIDNSLESMIESSEFYQELCDVNGYNPNVNSLPLLSAAN